MTSKSITQQAHLAENIFDTDKVQMVPTRDGFGKGLVEAGEKDERVVVLCADLTESTRSHWFAERFPERFIQIGVAEQNLATIAAGMANYGKIPFISSYAAFSPGRNNEQIRTTIAINDVPVKIAGAHAGVSVGPDGATHQALEDIALMRALPNMTVIVPCDAFEAQKATVAAAQNGKPTYIRLGREKSAVFTTQETPFEIGKATVLRGPELVERLQSGGPSSQNSSGRLSYDCAIIGCGMLLYHALQAAEQLAKEGIEAAVVNCHTIKPIDEETIVAIAQQCGAVVSVEEHQIHGGLGSAIAEVLARRAPTPQEFIGVQDRFGQSGKPEELIQEYGLGTSAIVAAAKKAIARKPRP